MNNLELCNRSRRDMGLLVEIYSPTKKAMYNTRSIGADPRQVETGKGPVSLEQIH